MTEKQIQSWRRRVYRFVNEVPGLTVEDYDQARKAFAERGIDFAHVPKGWRFWRWVKGRKAQEIILWCGAGLVREYLDDPETLVAALDRLEAELLSAVALWHKTNDTF